MLIIETVSVELERRTDQEIYLLEHSWGLYFKDKQASTSISLDLGLILQPENGPVNSGLSLDRIPRSFKIKGGWFRYFAPVMIVSWHTEILQKAPAERNDGQVCLLCDSGWKASTNADTSVHHCSFKGKILDEDVGRDTLFPNSKVCSMKSRWQNEKARNH